MQTALSGKVAQFGGTVWLVPGDMQRNCRRRAHQFEDRAAVFELLVNVARRGIDADLVANSPQEGVVDDGGQRVGARVVVVTHTASDAALSDTVTALAGLDVVQNVASVLRLEGSSE